MRSSDSRAPKPKNSSHLRAEAQADPAFLRAEIAHLQDRCTELCLAHPDKAALILAQWITQPAKKLTLK